MGQSQFMPSSFLNFAQDANGDGRKDIWHTEADVFASAANYLAKNGWERGYRWGRRVRLPQDFPKNMIDLDKEQSIGQWQARGVRLPGGEDLPKAPGLKASIIAPDGIDGPAFIVYNNFKVLMRWNRSTFFATSVGILSDSIAR
jgi:membrane-bound lytic murein transglycosylase B